MLERDCLVILTDREKSKFSYLNVMRDYKVDVTKVINMNNEENFTALKIMCLIYKEVDILVDCTNGDMSLKLSDFLLDMSAAIPDLRIMRLENKAGLLSTHFNMYSNFYIPNVEAI